MGIPPEIWKQWPFGAAMLGLVWLMLKHQRSVLRESRMSSERMHTETKEAQLLMHKENKEAQNRQLEECMRARKSAHEVVMNNTSALSRMETTLRDMKFSRD